MARPVRRRIIRRYRKLFFLLALAAILLLAKAIGSTALLRTELATGWLLATLVVGLALYNLRKKFPFLPLGSSANWLQIHIYMGLFSGILFLVHLQWQLPSGIFEIVLALLFSVVFVSGLLGLIISRVFARRLSTFPGEYLYRRISPMRHRILGQVERLVVQCMETTESTGVPEFYTRRLEPFFQKSRNFWHHLVLSNRPASLLLSELKSLERYLNETERDVVRQIGNLVKQKNDLDFHFAHQAILRYWLFIHVPLTYALLCFVAIHVVLVYAFSGAL